VKNNILLAIGVILILGGFASVFFTMDMVETTNYVEVECLSKGIDEKLVIDGNTICYDDVYSKNEALVRFIIPFGFMSLLLLGLCFIMPSLIKKSNKNSIKKVNE